LDREVEEISLPFPGQVLRSIHEDGLVNSRESYGTVKSSRCKAHESFGMRRSYQYIAVTKGEAERRPSALLRAVSPSALLRTVSPSTLLRNVSPSTLLRTVSLSNGPSALLRAMSLSNGKWTFSESVNKAV
jgi:3-methyladenine DNA glycosylase Mpg